MTTPPGELVPVGQLSASELEAVAELEALCLSHDGGRLKLEWPSLRNRPAGTTSDFLWVVGGEVVGFAGLYQWRPTDLELCGMVHPDWRRQGIGGCLYEAAAAEAAGRRPLLALLIVDRALEAGRELARSRGGRLDHSEHRMQQRREPELREEKVRVELRGARIEDAPFVAGCVAAAFGEEPARLDPGDREAAERVVARTTVIHDGRSGEPVGVLRVEREGGAASIYGFAVLPERQGRGYGRAALTAVTRRLHRSGVGVVSLEVLSTNEAALHLYETCGFDTIGTEDYYAMPLGDLAGAEGG
ncbi:MAG TPA: GNAT family N-acetyltransferase [Acidimicrobiales bacterium]|nr:GNAT family N-acetyltransferase [Acidimicrobiales bacterium]